jgi:hypothetical protein
MDISKKGDIHPTLVTMQAILVTCARQNLKYSFKKYIDLEWGVKVMVNLVSS